MLIILMLTTIANTYCLALSEPTIDDHIKNNDYKEALQLAKEIAISDPIQLTFNNNLSQLLEEYKLHLVNECSVLISQDKYTQAHQLLNDNLQYFKSDTKINTLLNNINTHLQNTNLQVYKGDITLLSINPLIAYPETGLSTKNANHKKNDEEHLTPYEFKKILQGLYNNNYILVKLNDVDNASRNIQNNNLYLPKGKKPIVLLFENLNYISQARSTGFVDKIIIDRYGDIATYTSKKSINNRIKYDNECITILEDFISNYPEFSHNSARAVICANNQNGFLGYKTAKTNATSKFEIKRAIEVADKLAELGYEFACGGFEQNKTLTDLNFASELNTWNNYTSSITGSTFIYVTNIPIDSDYKTNLLKDNGFTLIISHNPEYPPYSTKLNGKALREQDVSHLFDSQNVYDHLNRNIMFNGT